MRRRHELTDAQWDRIESLLPGKAADPGRTAADNRLFVNACLFALKTGVAWADLPERFGKPDSPWKRLRPLVPGGRVGAGRPRLGPGPVGRGGARRRRGGRGAARLHRRQGPPDGLDRPAAAGGKKEGADARRCLGRSRGGARRTPGPGLTTKSHAAVDGAGRLLRLVVTAGQRGDAPQAAALLDGLRPRHVIAEAAYDPDAIRGLVEAGGGVACVRPNPTRKRKKTCDRQRHKHRNVIERFFRRVKECRRVATRYEKKAANFAGFVWLAAGVTGRI